MNENELVYLIPVKGNSPEIVAVFVEYLRTQKIEYQLVDKSDLW